jgi:GMP synthase-like glutamine amidotransferase
VKAAVIAHDHLSDAGLLGDALSELGIDLDTVLVVPADRFSTPDVRAEFPDPGAHDLVLSLGAPWSVYDSGRLGRWVTDEQDYLRAADVRGVPVLGVCFGGQLLAAAHGGTVSRAARPELGWRTTDTDEPGLIEPGPWLEWHSDSWTVPAGARELARTEAASQAFVLRRNLAVQFHPEVTDKILRDWLGHGGAEAAAALGIDAEQLLAETAAAQPAAAERAHRLVRRFLDQVAFADR